MRYFLILGLIFLGTNILAQTNTFPSTGNVGIGTNSPNTKLNVNDSELNNRISQSGGTYTEFAQRTWSGSAGILFSAYASETYVNGGLYATGNTKYKFNASAFGSSYHGAKMIYADHTSIKFYISPASTGIGTDVNWGNSVLSLIRGGRIGVGTNSPVGKFNIVSSGTIASNWNNRSTSYLSITESDGTGMFFDSNEIQCWNSAGEGNNFYVQSAGNAGNTYINRSSGNVGIGTDSPDYKLSVNGTIGAKEVKVTSSGWPDFVFEPDYNLPTLLEVENFINQNGHLPDIPSAEEVKTDGINLGEMDAKLLQKIEELTLYAIQQESILERQSKEIKDLKILIQILMKKNEN